MTFLEWVASTFGTSVFLGILVFLLRNIILERLKNAVKHEYDIALESHKANLKRDYDIQIEKLKSQLQIANTRFAHIFVLQAEAIASTHKLILPLLDATHDYIHSIYQTSIEDKQKAQEKFNKLRSEFHQYFYSNLIYIPTDTAKLIKNFLDMVESYALKNSMFNSMVTLPTRNQNMEQQIEKYGDDIDKLREDVSTIMNKLVDNFQSILGVQKN